MSLRKVAGLLVVSGLVLGLIGGGVGAQFTGTLLATENIDVGTFSCRIINPSDGTVAGDLQSVTYTAPTIMSSAAGSAPFSFTVQNNGSINQQLTITASAVGGTLNSSKFSAMTVTPASPVALAAGASQAISTGIQWTLLDNTDLGDSGWVTWTVNCGEVPATRHWSEGIAGHIGTPNVDPSTNAINQSNGWPYVTVNDSTITFQSVRLFTDALGGSCIEYRFNNNVPDQIRHTVNGGNNWNTLVTDGLWPTKCIASDLNPIQTITIPAGVTTFEVRSAFGAEGDERFDWTRFNLLP